MAEITTINLEGEDYSIHAAVSDKIGTSTVGGTTTPVYIKSGIPAALSNTIGSAKKPVYLSSGAIKASDSTIGSSTKPVYMNAGTLTATSGKINQWTSLYSSSSGMSTSTKAKTISNLEDFKCFGVRLLDSTDTSRYLVGQGFRGSTSSAKVKGACYDYADSSGNAYEYIFELNCDGTSLSVNGITRIVFNKSSNSVTVTTSTNYKLQWLYGIW